MPVPLSVHPLSTWKPDSRLLTHKASVMSVHSLQVHFDIFAVFVNTFMQIYKHFFNNISTSERFLCNKLHCGHRLADELGIEVHWLTHCNLCNAGFSGTSFITIFTITGISGIQISVIVRLKPVCAFAICLEMTSTSFPFGEINCIRAAYGFTRKGIKLLRIY